MSESSNSKKPSSSLPLLIGGAAVLGVAALDGGVLTLCALGALGAGAYYVTDKALQSALEERCPNPENALVKNFAMTRKFVAGACGAAVFLNPFIGIPGTALIILGWFIYQGKMFAVVKENQAERKQAEQANA